MTADTVLARLKTAGLTVTADGGRLNLKPAARLTPELTRLAVAHKAELVAMLAYPSVRWSETGRSWFCPCGANVVADWPTCPYCGRGEEGAPERNPLRSLAEPNTACPIGHEKPIVTIQTTCRGCGKAIELSRSGSLPPDRQAPSGARAGSVHRLERTRRRYCARCLGVAVP